MKAYILSYFTGEYSDATMETVCVYFKKELVERHCKLANQWLIDKKYHMSNIREFGQRKYDIQPELCPYFPDLRSVDYTGSSFDYIEIPILEESDLNMMEGVTKDSVVRAVFADLIDERGIGDGKQWRS